MVGDSMAGVLSMRVIGDTARKEEAQSCFLDNNSFSRTTQHVHRKAVTEDFY